MGLDLHDVRQNGHVNGWDGFGGHLLEPFGGRLSVRHVVVDGQIVVRDRELLTLDVGAVKRAASSHARRLFAV